MTHWEAIREQLRKGRYQPQPVRRCEIPKAGGGTRALGDNRVRFNSSGCKPLDLDAGFGGRANHSRWLRGIAETEPDPVPDAVPLAGMRNLAAGLSVIDAAALCAIAAALRSPGGSRHLPPSWWLRNGTGHSLDGIALIWVDVTDIGSVRKNPSCERSWSHLRVLHASVSLKSSVKMASSEWNSTAIVQSAVSGARTNSFAISVPGQP